MLLLVVVLFECLSKSKVERQTWLIGSIRANKGDSSREPLIEVLTPALFPTLSFPLTSSQVPSPLFLLKCVFLLGRLNSPAQKRIYEGVCLFMTEPTVTILAERKTIDTQE